MIRCACARKVDLLVSKALMPATYGEWATYVLETRVQSLVGMLSIVILGSFIVLPWYVVAFLISFYLINTRSGGLHCSTYATCYFLTLLSTIGSLYMAMFFESRSYIIPLLLLGGTLILFWAPINNAEMHLSETELQNNKRILRKNQAWVLLLVLATWAIGTTLSVYLAQGYISAALGTLAQKVKTNQRRTKVNG